MTLADDLAQCDRETALQGGLYRFLKLVWPQIYPSSPFSDNWHYGLLTEHLEACYRGDIRELVINLPPGGGKSSLVCVVYPAWVWALTPDRSFIHAAYGEKLVHRDAADMLKLLQSNWWAKRFGDRFKIPTVPAKGLIKNDRGGFRLGTTPGGEVTGFHANYQLLDDPNKPEELTKVGLQNTKDWLARTLDSRWRRPPQVNSLVCIMQRLHCDDLAQTFLDREAMHLCLPAQFDPARRAVTTYGQDPRTYAGEVMDEVRLPLPLIQQLRKRLGPINAAAQLDQNPVPEGGAVFKRDWLQFWSTNPKTVADGVFIPGVSTDGKLFPCADKPLVFDHVINSWDCAFKDETTSDYVAGGLWGRAGSSFVLMDQICDQLDFPATLHAVLQLKRRMNATTIIIEDKANGTGVVQMLTKSVPGVVAVDPQGGKYSRASAVAGFWEAKNVFLPDPGMPGYEWVLGFILELLTFPRAKHDDQVDQMSQALLYLQTSDWGLKEAMDVVRKQMGLD